MVEYKHKILLRTISFILCFILLAFVSAFAQKFSGETMRNVPGKPGIWIITGNSKIVANGNRIFSDFAEYDQNTGSCEAYGNLIIKTRDKVTITGKKLFYDGKSEIYDVIDDVVLKDGEVVMKTPALKYEGATNRANYDQGAVMTSGETVLTSNTGYYDGITEVFHCYQDVVIVNPQYTIWTDTLHQNKDGKSDFFGPTTIETTEYYMFCKEGWFNQNTDEVSLVDDAYIKTQESQILYGDSIFYNLKFKNGNVHRNVFLKDTVRNCFIKSEYAENDEIRGYAFFTSDPRGILIDNNDSIFIVSDTMRITYDTSKQVDKIFAYHKVEVFKSDIQALCDSLVYRHADSMMYLYIDPIVWMEGYQIDGDTIRVWFGNQRPDSLMVNKNAFMVSEVYDSTEYFNQIQSRELYGYFNDSSQFRMARAEGRAEAIYYVLDEEKMELTGINKSISASLKMYFENNEVKGINLIKPEEDAFLYPEETLTERQKLLRRFHWRPKDRPRSKYDLSTRW